jgi:hypothetical protein
VPVVAGRGRPGSHPKGGELARLAAASRLSLAEGDVLDLGPPLRPARRALLPSKALAKARKHER